MFFRNRHPSSRRSCSRSVVRLILEFASSLFFNYRARQKNGSQVARILFLLLLTTAAWPCLKNSRNLGTILLPGPVHSHLHIIAHFRDGQQRAHVRRRQQRIRNAKSLQEAEALAGLTQGLLYVTVRTSRRWRMVGRCW